ncbi:metal-dependent phosphohydrolase [Mycobacterium sp. DL592]|uniref:HD domain-containing protein n=1 Tax=Mycobacterium sp. DL592 TaxID=2675524 RepID=UPI00141F0ACD|nr:metal-dependent phosphohydrolase [Mycobacterium sp. DL592]
MQDLLEMWAALLARHTANPDTATVGSELLAAWSEPHRRYHSVEHLRDILGHVEELAALADDADAVRLAAWYHDSVYAGRPDDEELSARRAEGDLSGLGVEPQLVDEVARLIRMTVSHDPAPGDHNGEVLSDADLASLAVPRERYVANTAAIRAEYRHVSDEVFRKGRLQVLANLLGGPGVFRTEHARRHWEPLAQHNLRAELATLTD